MTYGADVGRSVEVGTLWGVDNALPPHNDFGRVRALAVGRALPALFWGREREVRRTSGLFSSGSTARMDCVKGLSTRSLVF